jgi:hypothetical protein
LSNLLYFSPIEWGSFAQRPHKFVEWFHRRHGGSVLWIEPYPTRLPNFGDLRTTRCSAENLATVSCPAWLKVVRPGGFPIEPLLFGDAVNRRVCWGKTLEQISQFLTDHETVILVGKPSQLAVDVLKNRGSRRAGYDAMDDFPSFYSGLSRRSMGSREREIGRLVDFVWTSSTPLFERWSRRRGEVQLVCNALDPFVIPLVSRTDAKVDTKVFGYVGTVAQWFDWQWVDALAKARPQDEVRIIGPIIGTRKPPSLPANVTFRPACSHDQAMSEMSRFDVGLIPFKKTHLTNSVDPIKYYEYRAVGMPVVSTEFGEMALRKTEDGLYLATENSLDQLIERALEYKRAEVARQKFLAENSWDSRFDAAGFLS